MPANVKEMFYAGKRPWHGLGRELSANVTSAEAIVAAGLDWDVMKIPVHTRHPVAGFSQIAVPKRFAYCHGKTGHVFEIMSDGFIPIQNSTAFEFFDAVIGEGKAVYHTAGSLGHGEIIWILAQIPGNLVIRKTDEVEKFLLFANGHDGTLAARILWTPVRVVCQNTLQAAIHGKDVNESGYISILHRGEIRRKVEEAQRVLGMAGRYYEEFGIAAEALAAKQVGMKQVDLLLEHLFPLNGIPDDDPMGLKPRMVKYRNEVERLFMEGKGNDSVAIRGSAWAPWNGVAEWTDHHRISRGENDLLARSNRMRSVWLGAGREIKRDAFRAIAKIVGVGSN